MRIHDIAVVADPNRRLHDEPEPEVADGTAITQTSSSSKLEATSVLNGIAASVNNTWVLENFWPWLYVLSSGVTSSAATYLVRLSIDLLGSLRVHDMSVLTATEESSTPEQVEAAGASFVDYLALFLKNNAGYAAIAFLIGVASRMIDVAAKSVTFVSLWQIAVLSIMIIAWMLLVLSYMAILDYLVSEEIITPWAAASSILFVILGFAAGTLINSLRQCWAIFGYFSKYLVLTCVGWEGVWPKDWNRLGYSIISLAFKVIILIYCVHYFARFFALGASEVDL
jgi:hypothetical protein